MNYKIKKKNLFLIDDISPYKNFINARKTLRNIYLKSKKSEKKLIPKTIISRNINNNTNRNLRTLKMPNIKLYSKKLLKEQKFIISHFSKGNESDKSNFLYNNNSLIKTLDRLNYIRYKNDKVNLITKYSQKNIFKTIPNNRVKHGFKSEKKEKINYENMNFPIIKHIFRKKDNIKMII